MTFHCDIKYKIPNSTDQLNIKLNVENTEILHLTGKNGSGKTTLFNMINGFINPTSGIIKLNDTILFDHNKNINIKPYKRKIARVFQKPSLFPNMNVLHNLKFSNKNQILLQQLIEELNLKDLLKKDISSLSGGQQKKISITQSLINNPQLILLDEAFANVDRPTTDKIKNIIKNLNIKTIITTHNTEDIINFANKAHCIDELTTKQTCYHN